MTPGQKAAKVVFDQRQGKKRRPIEAHVSEEDLAQIIDATIKVMPMVSPDSRLIEPRFKSAIDAWVQQGRMPGGFMQEVLRNNLHGAICHGDAYAVANIPHIVSYLGSNAPAACWGGGESVRAWAHKMSQPGARSPLAPSEE